MPHCFNWLHRKCERRFAPGDSAVLNCDTTAVIYLAKQIATASRESNMVGYGGGRNGLTNFVSNTVDQNCCAFWTNGCGLNPLFRTCAQVLEGVTPIVEQLGNVIWIFGSPLAFPLVFCFSPDPHTKESSGYEISMCEAPCRRPITCCFATVCVPCAQWHARRVVLEYDMSKYKLWQGYHDGPQCCARVCPNAPITIRSGTYGEEKCPNLFLCFEVYVIL
jgi:hypothetical protein